MYCMLWFNFILGLNLIFFRFKLIVKHYHTQKQKKIKFKPRIKLNHNMYITKKKTIWKKERSNTRKLTKNFGLHVRIKLMTLRVLVWML